MDRSTPFYMEAVEITSGYQAALRFYPGSGDEIQFDTIEVSTDLLTWTTPVRDGLYHILLDNVSVGDRVYVRAKPVDGTYYKTYGGHFTPFRCDAKIGGNILSLFYGSNFTGNETSFIEGTNNCRHIFRGGIADASELLLTPTTLPDKCYQYMFENCIELIKAPTITQATLPQNRWPYDYMFQGCSSLESLTIENTNLRNNDYILYGMAPKTIVYKKEGVTTPGNPNNLTVVTLKNTPFNVANAKQWVIGNKKVKRVVDSNGRLIWGKRPTPDPSSPFYFRNLSGTPTKICVKSAGYYSPTINYQYSYDKINWNSKSSTGTGFDPSWVTIPAFGTVYIRAMYDTWNYYDESQGVTFVTWFRDNWGDYHGERLVVGGNIMSLFYGSNFAGKTSFPSSSTNRECYRFFEGMENIVDASELVLPVTTMHIASYDRMFFGNTNLIYPPVELPATLEAACYRSMFGGCSSLIYTPNLPATTLYRYCYRGMFSGCSALHKVVCNALTGFDTDDPTDAWLNNVASVGEFHKNPSATGWTTGVSGIPTGWMVVNI